VKIDDDCLWIVIPAYNEERVIGSVVEDVVRRYPNVVVVDDCSTDSTGAAASAAGAHVVPHPINLGQGGALQTGFDYALSHGAQAVVTFDADGQHCVEDIDALRAAIELDGCDVALGSRFLGEATRVPTTRVLLLRAAVFFTWITSGLRLSDTHNGLRMLNRRALQTLRIRQNRMAHASELLDQIGASELRYKEVPVRIVYTEYSLAKGQRSSAAFRILADLFLARISK